MAQEYMNVQPQAAIQSQVSRRSRMETFGDMLRAIGAGAEKPTHIMYKANLSWSVMQAYIKSLEAQGLVTTTISEQGKRLYHLSDKGFQLLSQFLSIRQDLNLESDA
ncbi:MAG: winged helix-turn-helix domain-containing protein [Nitrososphaerales archaeon]